MKAKSDRRTPALSGPQYDPKQRRRRDNRPRACGAPLPSFHGPLQRIVRPQRESSEQAILECGVRHWIVIGLLPQLSVASVRADRALHRQLSEEFR